MTAPTRGVVPTAQPAAWALPNQVHALPVQGIWTLVATYHVHWPNGNRVTWYGPGLPPTLIAKTPRLPTAAGRLASYGVGVIVEPRPAGRTSIRPSTSSTRGLRR